MIGKIATAGIITAGIIIIAVLGYQRVDRSVKNEAVNTCFSIATGEYKNEVESGQYFDQAKYDQCMTEKGYK